MSVKFVRNKRYRKLYANIEAELLAFKYVIRSQKLSYYSRWLASVYLSKYKFSSRTRLANHCFLSSRRRGFVRFSGLSRQQMRLLARNGQLPFIEKASW